MNAREASDWVKRQAAELGFERCGVAEPGPIGRGDYLRAWLAAGRAGSMAYLQRNLESRLDPARLLPDARSAIVVALNYYQTAASKQSRARKEAVGSGSREATEPRRHEESDEGTEPRSDEGVNPAIANRQSHIDHESRATGGLSASAKSEGGRIARYAWGRDYHRVVKGKLHKLADAMRERLGPDVATRTCVDTAPIIERELAALAGVGWIGKNTLVLHHELGSYFVLGVLLTTLELEPDAPLDDHCGSCTACLDACPTAAFPKPYEMDAARCISYLTIEHRGHITAEFHNKMGDWVFGCDVCQEVCPFNHEPPVTNEPDFATRPPGPVIDPASILNWTPEDYDKITRGSATRRATLDMWKRNAWIVTANATEQAS